MTINLKGTNITFTPEIREYLDKRLEGLGKFLPADGRSFMADVELGRTTTRHQTGPLFRAEINIASEGANYRAVSEGENLYIAIDGMKDEIIRELRTRKEKRISLLRRSGQKIKELLRGLRPRRHP